MYVTYKQRVKDQKISKLIEAMRYAQINSKKAAVAEIKNLKKEYGFSDSEDEEEEMDANT